MQRSVSTLTPLNTVFETNAVRIVYGRVPGGRPRVVPSVSEPYAFDLAFIGHDNYPVSRDDRPTERVDIRPGHGAIHGGERVAFLGDGSAAEYVEITPSSAMLSEVANTLRCREARYLGEIGNLFDGVMWSVSSEVRRRALKNQSWSDIEADTMGLMLTEHMLVTYFGGRRRERSSLGLDKRRFSRVTAHIEEHLSETLSLGDLAGTAALSRFHFIRAFKISTGLTPFQYLTSRRMARARVLLQTTEDSVSAVAEQVGYSSSSHFRRIFKDTAGYAPSAYRKAVAPTASRSRP